MAKKPKPPKAITVLALAFLGPNSISDESRTRFHVRRLSIWDRIDILDWIRLLINKPMHAGDLVAWVWLRRCDEEDEGPVVDTMPGRNTKKPTNSAKTALDVQSWLRFLLRGELIEPVSRYDEHPYNLPTGEVILGANLINPEEPNADAAMREPLRWTWRLRMKPDEAKTLWLDGTVHVELSPWEERRADRARWHNRYRRSQRLLPGASVIET